MGDLFQYFNQNMIYTNYVSNFYTEWSDILQIIHKIIRQYNDCDFDAIHTKYWIYITNLVKNMICTNDASACYTE